MSQTVVGLFEDRNKAEAAVQRLREVGISSDNIDLARGGSFGSSADKDSGIVRFFKSLFGDSDDTDRYVNASNDNTTILTVHAQSGDQADRASQILDDAGAMDVDDEVRRSHSGSYSDSDATISRVQEELQVGKREVESGGVRVRSRIVHTPVEETLRLREEHVHIERRDVNRPLSDGDRSVFEEQEIELTETTEVPVVNKESRVVEEIKISKDVNERTETVRDTVRNTEVDIDKIDETRRDRND